MILYILIGPFTSIILAGLLDLYDEDAWYSNWKNWLIGALCFLFPLSIMIVVFMIQLTTSIAEELDVSGSDIYKSPYTWLICMIVPFVGWSLLIVMYLYLVIQIITKIHNGKLEKYI
jgi:TRAP-type mannitol/chloroaromatic compound transport system permease small subunit